MQVIPLSYRPPNKNEYSKQIKDILTKSAESGIYIDKWKMEEIEKELQASIIEKTTKFTGMLAELGYPNGSITVKTDIARLFLARGVPEHYYLFDNSYHTDNEILERIYADFKLEEVRLIQRYRSDKKKFDSIAGEKGIKCYCEDTDLVNNEDHPLCIVRPKFTMSETMRYTYIEPNLSGLTSTLYALLSAPKGKVVVSFDIRQQEPTVFFSGILNCKPITRVFKKHIDDKYFALARFCLTQQRYLTKIAEELDLTKVKIVPEDAWYKDFIELELDGTPKTRKVKSKLEPIINFTNLNEFVADNLLPASYIDKSLRDKYKVAILAGGYGAGAGTLIAKAGKEVGTCLYNMLTTLPEMIRYKELINTKLESVGVQQFKESDIEEFDETFGLNNVEECHEFFEAIQNERQIAINCLGKKKVSKEILAYSLFGTVFRVKQTDSRGRKRTKSGFVRALINMPTQTTGSDILRLVINFFMQWKLNNNISDDLLNLAFTKHDEIICYADKSLVPRLDEIKENMELQIEDWSPLLIDVTYGDHYTK